MSTDLLGEGFTKQFQACGHRPVDEVGAEAVLRQFKAGEREQIRNALHTIAGHATPALVPALPQHRKNLRDVASALKNGTFATNDFGTLVAGGQYQTARIGHQAGSPVSDGSIIEVYQSALGSERVQGDDKFRSWMVGTTLAALRLSTRPQAGIDLLRVIVSDPALQSELLSTAPSQLRYVVIFAAPSLCMPQLFDLYEPAIKYGSAEERGAALLHVAQVPAIKAALQQQSRTLPSGIIDRARQWADALEFALQSPDAQFIIPPNKDSSTKMLAEHRQVERIVGDLREAAGYGRSASRSGAVAGIMKSGDELRRGLRPGACYSGESHICGPSCATHNRNLIPL